ncbi:Phospholipase/carboxylesterase/thioesterase [Jimgerdemannia flammicorona]|uniref:Acyl-protein thioesterase 1 n=1 Tax=Jimgerdemannia flammicorona TaxID=994334 RepID=A0A433D8D5_9FUNG|nr:Phospholipase/carboxylesterase/thioesterase [Jimgerdemannia flammicorona]
MSMPSWYDITSLASLDETASEPGIMESAGRVSNLIKEEIETGIPSERIVVAGFSQGSSLQSLTQSTNHDH